ncbi:MAG: Glu-tRNA(Gln) amidotransferase subunit GatD [archaeon]
MNHGDVVEVKTAGKTFKGTYMPSSDSATIVLKLDSGYNIGIDVKKVKSKKVVKKHKVTAVKQKPVKQKKGLKKIVILHTGGTVASKVDYETGAVSAKFDPEELLAMFPELKKVVNISSRLIRNMMSDDMRFAHYNIMAKEIEKEIKKGVDGIIITQGTDTLHYSSAALSFVLDGLNVPVLFVGAQRSSDRGSSDAAMNLICASHFIASTSYNGVGICMHKNSSDDKCVIINGVKARKLHTSRRDAFRVVNDEPLAEVDYKTGSVKLLRSLPSADRKLKLKLFKEDLKVGMCYAHPNMFVSELNAYSGYDGLVLIGTGLGHFPINEIDNLTKEHKKIFSSLKKLCSKMPVVMAPQTIYGRIDMNVYSPGRTLIDIGVLGNLLDMVLEVAFVKLGWLLSNYPKDVSVMYGQDLRGEISSRSTVEFE